MRQTFEQKPHWWWAPLVRPSQPERKPHWWWAFTISETFANSESLTRSDKMFHIFRIKDYVNHINIIISKF